MKTQIENILKSILPSNIMIYVSEGSIMNDPYIKIGLSVSDIDINNVRGQKPQLVSLILYLKTLELKPQCFGGCGGQYIYRKPNKNIDEEKYLAMKGVKIPFRKLSKPTIDNVLNNIKLFANNYIKILKENKNDLMYQEYVNYDEILK